MTDVWKPNTLNLQWHYFISHFNDSNINDNDNDYNNLTSLTL